MSPITTRAWFAPTGSRRLQRYNAQTVVNDRQIVLAAEITTDSPDFGPLEPMVRA